jgi:hypothetical protein
MLERSALKHTTAKPTIAKRTTGLLASAALLGVLLVALAIAGAWPFGFSKEIGDGGHSVIWKGEAALLAGDSYALDLLPIRAESDCPFCLSLRSEGHGQRLTLYAGNGILGWPEAGVPSYQDCVELRNHMTLDSVALGAPRTSHGALALHGWACATGGGTDGLIRLRYDGARGERYRFAVTSWGRPAEG